MIRWLIVTLICLTQPALASDQPIFDQVSLSASASSEVANDVLTADLFAQAEGQEAQSLASEVNRKIAWGLEQAEKASEVSARTLDYRTQPVYRNSRVDGWRVSQSLRLESRDTDAISKLIGVLQKQLSVRSVNYTVSPEHRKDAEDRLIDEAIAAFSERAERVAAAFGKSGYRLVSVQVDTNDALPSPRPYAARAMAMSESAVAPPTLDAGTSEIRVVVSGTIELTP